MRMMAVESVLCTDSETRLARLTLFVLGTVSLESAIASSVATLVARFSSHRKAKQHPDSIMPSSAIGPLILFLAILLTTAHLLGYLFAKLRQPRVIGEILAGIVLGPFVLGRWPAYTHILQLNVATAPKKAALDLIYYMGLLMLMFISGAETKALFQKHERRQIAWLAAMGTMLPFFAMLALG